MMRIKNLFEKQVFVRLTGDQTGLICTVKWPLLSLPEVIRAIVNESESGFAPPVAKPPPSRGVVDACTDHKMQLAGETSKESNNNAYYSSRTWNPPTGRPGDAQ
jgi:hypothetical protein